MRHKKVEDGTRWQMVRKHLALRSLWSSLRIDILSFLSQVAGGKRGNSKAPRKPRKKSQAAMDLSSEDEALFVSIAFGKIHRVVSLLEHVENVNIRSAENATPLIQACKVTQGELCSHITRLLIKRKCDVNARDGTGTSALMYACMNPARVDAARILARHKDCDTNLADDEGRTALMHAVDHGNAAAVEILLFNEQVKCKVDVDAHSLHGSSALDMAVERKDKVICKLLVTDAGADTSHLHDIAKLNALLKKG
ncbi:ankyrin repeat domain-containing protein 50 [Elysia marginata]|uniref:Ankyrin repeat domain-containing protein 50 n=1 Tax=Elysia marginata TaxID=1093978 RepID=A0AAV4GKG6_9GAST|nr:ankyrin repeat domain-containing protein 50 [Elysia marginata]